MEAMAIAGAGSSVATAPLAPFTGKPAAATRDAGADLLADLLDGVAEIAELLHARAAQADRSGHLTRDVVEALVAGGFWRMRLCRELGGLELPIVAQIEVIAALAAEDASAAWCTMIANDGLAVLGTTMPQAALDRIFAAGVPACSIVAAPGGIATPTDGGYRLTGTWRLASGVHHAEWISASALVERDPSRVLPLAIPARDVELVDSWTVVGLAGTGSNDFTLTDYFLPSSLVGHEHGPYAQLRGTRRYDLVDLDHIESYEHLAFAIGIGRRALREFRAALAAPPSARLVSDREVVQEELGKAAVRLRSVEALAFSLFDRVDRAAVGEPQSWSAADRYLPRALAASATELALECVHLAFHRAGLLALHRPNIFEKLLRDMSVAATHAMVDDAAFPAYAQHLIETGALPDQQVRAGRAVAA